MNAPKISIIALGIYTYVLMGSLIFGAGEFRPLQEQHLESFNWISQETPADSKILVITGKDWTYDSYSEWMAALTGRSSVSLVQGYEWLPGFSDRASQYYQFQYEYSKGMTDLVSWINQNHIRVDFLVLPKGDEAEIRQWSSEPALHWHDAALFPGADKVFENESVLILDLRGVMDPTPYYGEIELKGTSP